MKKITYFLIIPVIITLLTIVSFLSFFGYETNKFNNLEMHKRRQEPQCEDYAAAVRALVFELN